jgi:putative holliday junction resolvase
MALDLGDKRIGVAVSDELGLTAQGLDTLIRTSADADLGALRKIVEEHGVDRIVIGLPVNMNGTEGLRAVSARAFASRLEETLSLPCVLWDERLTTKAAERVLIEADVSRKKRKGVVDRLAAQLILQGYLEANRASPEDAASSGQEDP